MKENKSITIKDLAQTLGIAVSTVSRALHDHPSISSETRNLVKKKAEELKYRPNVMAMGLRQNKSMMIGIVIPQIVHYFFSTVISGVEDFLNEKGYSVIITQSNESKTKEQANIRSLIDHRVDGLLICAADEEQNIEVFHEALEEGVPVVFFDRKVEGCHCSMVLCDDFQGGYLATRHLYDSGKRRIAHLAGPASLQTTKDRLSGYKKALIDLGLGIDPNLVEFEYGIDIEYAMENAMKLLKSKHRPTGIFANNDPAALGVLMAAKQLNIDVPKDLAIIGFSNWQITNFTEPKLSTIDQPGYEIGKKAAEILYKQITHREELAFKPKNIVLPVKLIPRQSTTPLIN